MRITEVTAADVLAHCPELEPFNAAERGDLFICANGFEDRALAVAETLTNSVAHFNRAVMLTYTSSARDNEALRPGLETALSQFTDEVFTVDGEMTDTLFASALTEHIASASAVAGPARILFDISGCSGRFILRVLRVLFDIGTSSRKLHLRLAYTQAASYAPTEAEAAEILRARTDGPKDTPATLGLDWDAGEIAHLIERPGQHIDHAPDRAIVICGFNADRIRASLDRIDTDFNVDFPHPRVTYIAGLPPRPKDRWRLDAMVAINSSEEGAPSPLTASTLDYRDTLKLLEAIYDDSAGRHKLTVIPFGSKMQSVAVGLFCEAHADVRVQMLAPSYYRSVEYSTGVEEIHQLDLEDVSELSLQLRRIGELKVAGSPGAIPDKAFSYDEGVL